MSWCVYILLVCSLGSVYILFVLFLWNELPVVIRNIEDFNEFKIVQKQGLRYQLPNIDGTFF